KLHQIHAEIPKQEVNFEAIFPFSTNPDGFDTYLSINIKQPIVHTNLSFSPFIQADNILLDIHIHYPRIWNSIQDWNVDIKTEKAQIYFIFVHKNFFQALINDWASSIPPDIYSYASFIYNITIDRQYVEVLVPCNQGNWIDCTNDKQQPVENNYIFVWAKSISLKYPLLFLEFCPTVTPMDIAIEVNDVFARLVIPESSRMYYIREGIDAHKRFYIPNGIKSQLSLSDAFERRDRCFDCCKVNNIKKLVQILLHTSSSIDTNRSDLLYIQHVKSMNNRQTFHPNKLDYDVFNIEIDIGPHIDNEPYPIAFCERFCVEMTTDLDETRLQVFFLLINLYIEDRIVRNKSDQHLSTGNLQLSGFVIHGHAMLSHEDLLSERETLEYAWQLEVIFDEILAHGKNFYLQIIEDEYILTCSPVIDRTKWIEKFKYDVLRFSLDSINFNFVEIGNVVNMQIAPIRLCISWLEVGSINVLELRINAKFEFHPPTPVNINEQLEFLYKKYIKHKSIIDKNEHEHSSSSIPLNNNNPISIIPNYVYLTSNEQLSLINLSQSSLNSTLNNNNINRMKSSSSTTYSNLNLLSKTIDNKYDLLTISSHLSSIDSLNALEEILQRQQARHDSIYLLQKV
ncbi:unnamed protein product, partial [Rotaria sp. Silwood1]